MVRRVSAGSERCALKYPFASSEAEMLIGLGGTSLGVSSSLDTNGRKQCPLRALPFRVAKPRGGSSASRCRRGDDATDMPLAQPRTPRAALLRLPHTPAPN